MISHHHKCVFIHIPKNAGQSIEHVFLDLLGLKWEERAPLLLRPNDLSALGPPRLAHLQAKDYVKYKYLPEEMFDTYYKFAVVRNPWWRTVSIFKYLGFEGKMDFKTFLLNELQGKLYREMYWFVGPQNDFVCDEEGRIIVDHIIKFENLQAGFDDACSAMSLGQITVPHVNRSGLEKKGVPSMTYSEYYDQEAVDLVANLYRRDIELFDYSYN